MGLETLIGVMLASVGLPFFGLATLESLRNYRLSNSLVWFCAGAAGGLSVAVVLFWMLLQLAPHIAVLAMVLALLVQLSAFAFVGVYVARKRAVEKLPL